LSCWVIAHYRQRTQSGRPEGATSPCSPRHRRLLWRRSHYLLSPVQRRKIERPRASRRTREPYARLGSRGCWSNAHPAAGCTKSPCVMRISTAPLMLWVDRTGSASGAKGSADSHLLFCLPGHAAAGIIARERGLATIREKPPVFRGRGLWARPHSSIWLPESSTGTTTSLGNVR
jgi:hypothetical protein